VVPPFLVTERQKQKERFSTRIPILRDPTSTSFSPMHFDWCRGLSLERRPTKTWSWDGLEQGEQTVCRGCSAVVEERELAKTPYTGKMKQFIEEKLCLKSIS
jgi:hypothetical protein